MPYIDLLREGHHLNTSYRFRCAAVALSALLTNEFSMALAQQSSSSDPYQSRLDDARALTTQQWTLTSKLIVLIEIGRACGVVEDGWGHAAIEIGIRRMLVNQGIANGVAGDPSMDVQLDAEIKRATEQGRGIASAPEFCSRNLSPADRARIRELADNLMR